MKKRQCRPNLNQAAAGQADRSVVALAARGDMEGLLLAMAAANRLNGDLAALAVPAVLAAECTVALVRRLNR